MDKRIFGICPACRKIEVMTHHHVYPKKFFGHLPYTIKLCWPCHQELHRRLPDDMRSKEFYDIVLRDFIKNYEHNGWL